MKRQTKRTMSNRESGYYDKPKKVRPVGPDGFYSDEPEQKIPKSARGKTTYDRSKGKHVKKATKTNAKEWYGRKISGSTPRPLRERKADLDKKIKEGGG